MKKFETENGYITITTDDCNDNELIIDMLEVKVKRIGEGTKLVEMAKEYARSEGKELTLCAYPINDDMELSELIAFYEHCGFTLDYDDGNTAKMYL